MTGVIGECAKPVLLGYICRGLLGNERQAEELELEMADFAHARGFLLAKTYVEQAVDIPRAFGELVNSLINYGGDAVLLPGLLHLAVLGPQHDMKRLIERATGARVLVM